MGQLDLPESGTVCLDTNTVIYSVEKIEPYATLLAPLWDAAATGRFDITGSQLLLLETLIQPIRQNDVELEEIYRELLTRSDEVQLFPITIAVIERAVQLRASYRLRTPDAIHAATAQLADCDLFITNDSHFRQVSDLPVAVLHDYVEA